MTPSYLDEAPVGPDGLRQPAVLKGGAGQEGHHVDVDGRAVRRWGELHPPLVMIQGRTVNGGEEERLRSVAVRILHAPV